MDEIKDPTQDTSHIEDSSEKGKESTSTETKTYTKESEEKAVSDALSVAGRDAKTLSGKTVEAERILTDAKKMQADVQVAQERWQKERDDAAREAHKDDPDALTSLNERIRQRNEATKLAEDRRKLDADTAKYQERLDGADKVTKELSARDIASKHNVDAESLIKFTDGSTEAMEELAKQLPKKGDAKSLKTDSGTTIGGTGWRDLSPDEKIRQGTK